MSRWIAAFACCASAVFANSPAHAQTVVAGWDFSLYFSSGGTVVDNTFENATSIDAQFSELDTAANPNPGLGPESAAFGTMYHDGSFASTDTSVGDPFVPGALQAITGELTEMSEVTVPFSIQMSTAGARNALVAEGQPFGNDLSLGAATAPVNVVFEADRSPSPQLAPGTAWTLTLAGIVISSQAAPNTLDVPVQFSEDGSGYTLAETITFELVSNGYEVALGESTSDTVYVRLRLPQFARIDNVAITVPEPGATIAGASALLGLAVLRRRRSLR